jgi:hypothetical protein
MKFGKMKHVINVPVSKAGHSLLPSWFGPDIKLESTMIYISLDAQGQA